MHPMVMFLKFPLILIQHGLHVLGHVVRNVAEKHWDRYGLGRRYYKGSITVGHFR